MTTRRFTIDVESTSTADLKRLGAAAYWEHPDTRVICVCYAVDDGPVHTWRPGDPVPPVVADMMLRWDDWRLIAHNWLFEFNCWKNRLALKHGWPSTPMRAWDCTMARALYWGLPAGLGDVTEALNLPVQKDATARALMLRMSRPRTVATATTPATWWHETDPDKLKALEDYCVRDVEAERCLDAALPPLPAREREIFLIDGKINQRGIRVDLPVIAALANITKAEGARLNGVMSRLTNGAANTTNQVAVIQKFLDGIGVSVPDLTRATVKDALARVDPLADGRAWAILACRQEAAKASTAKLAAMSTGASAHDDRCRGLFQYGGAGRTLRWAGRRVQPQNYPRGTVKDLPSIFRLVEQGVPVDELAALLPGTVMDAVSSCLRGCFIPAPGHVFVAGDLSQIEARVVAWLAGQNDLLAVFARGEDVYVYTAAKIGSKNRQLGKVLVLACVGHGTLVLTSVGWKPIQNLHKTDKVWDGSEWVSHGGLLARGNRETLDISGARLTPDHLVLCGTDWLPAQSLVRDDATLSRALATASGNSRSPASLPGHAAACPVAPCGATAGPPSISWYSTVSAKAARFGAWTARVASKLPPARCIGATRALSLTTGTDADCSTASRPSWAGATIRRTLSSATTAAGASMLGRLGARTGLLFSRISLLLRGGTIRFWNSIARTTTGDMSRATCGSSRAAKTSITNETSESSSAASSNSNAILPTYDIAHAGPRNRFTVWTDRGPLITHNCGFGMGPSKFQDTAATYGITLDTPAAEEAVKLWRDANPKIVSFWWDVDREAKRVAASPHGTEGRVGKVGFRKTRKALRIVLPSGRELTYQNIEVAPEADCHGRDEISYMGVDPKTKAWTRLRTYGGKLVENITQATARDVMAEAMIALSGSRAWMVGTVHDELIAEAPADQADDCLAHMLKVMRTTPVWAPGLPVGAEGFKATRYRK